MNRLTLTLAITVALGMPAYPADAARDVVPVLLMGFTGTPADSAARTEFMDAFKAAMDEPEFACERRSGDEWRPGPVQQNRFRLVDLAAPEAAWTLNLTIGLPPEIRVKRVRPKPDPKLPPLRPRVSQVRASRGLTIVVTAVAPRAALAGEPADASKFAVYFADARRVVVPSTKLPGGGYDYPWADAGRVVARAALEVLHRANEQFSAEQRADLAPATRVAVTQ